MRIEAHAVTDNTRRSVRVGLPTGVMNEAIAQGRLPRRTALLRRVYPLHVEMGVVALVLLVWQAARIPLEGSTSLALAHAHSWLAAERELHVDAEASVLRFTHIHGPVLHDLLRWAYGNLHVPVLLAFMTAVRLSAPERYPKLRTAFVAAHAPALVVIGLWPLAPPHWVSSLPFASGPPTDAQTTLGETLRNATAATVSMHFGVPMLIAGTALWLAPRRPLAWLALLYPPFVFFVILGTGNHYVPDTALGTACVALGATVAHLLHGSTQENGPSAGLRRILPAVAAAVLGGYIVNAALTGRLP